MYSMCDRGVVMTVSWLCYHRQQTRHTFGYGLDCDYEMFGRLPLWPAQIT